MSSFSASDSPFKHCPLRLIRNHTVAAATAAATATALPCPVKHEKQHSLLRAFVMCVSPLSLSLLSHPPSPSSIFFSLVSSLSLHAFTHTGTVLPTHLLLVMYICSPFCQCYLTILLVVDACISSWRRTCSYWCGDGSVHGFATVTLDSAPQPPTPSAPLTPLSPSPHFVRPSCSIYFNSNHIQSVVSDLSCAPSDVNSTYLYRTALIPQS